MALYGLKYGVFPFWQWLFMDGFCSPHVGYHCVQPDLRWLLPDHVFLGIKRLTRSKAPPYIAKRKSEKH